MIENHTNYNLLIRLLDHRDKDLGYTDGINRNCHIGPYLHLLNQ